MDAAPADHDPGTDAGLARTEATGLDAVRELRAPSGAKVLIGIASWTDPTMTARGVFYPPKTTSAEARLRYYSARFPIVEVDATYYALPARGNSELWADRTPDGFTINVKAHALMTGQPSEVARLPKIVRNALPPNLAEKKRVYAHELPPEIRDGIWAVFLDALEPLRMSGKMGALLLQYPKWFIPNKENAAVIEDARARLEGWRSAVEFRNKLWFADRLRDRTLHLLRRNELSLVATDSPPGFDSELPRIGQATSQGLAVVRFHGRNTDTWEAKVAKVADRFRYLYDAAQLSEWLSSIRALTEQAEEVHVLFNNCYGNYATTNAFEMTSLLLGAGFEV
jgi:uncharacterized protein YecE (DUF72 family)